MFSKYEEQAKKVLVNMKQEMIGLKHPYIGSEHLLLSLLKYGEKSIKDKLKNHGITYDIFKNELIKIVGIGKESNDFYLYTPLLRNILETVNYNVEENNKEYATCEDLLLGILEEGEGVAIRIMLGMNINIDDLYEDFYVSPLKKSSKEKLLVESYGVDLTLRAKEGELDPVVDRDDEIKRLIEILSRRTKNNPILIGEAGVGKTAVVEGLAKLIVENKVPTLKNKKIISVSMANLVAGTKYRGEFEERLGKIINELENTNEIILFIDEIHTLVGAGGAEGAIDASNILKPALARGKIKIIGATTTDEYKEFIEKDKALDRRFQKIEIKEPSIKTTINILNKLTSIYEKYHNVKISNDIVEKIVYYSEKYIYDRKFPDKAIDILDEVCSKVSTSDTKKYKEYENINNELNITKNLKNTSIVNNKFSDAFLYKQKEMMLESKLNELELKNINKSYLKTVTLKDVKEVVEQKTKIPIYEGNKTSSIKNIITLLNKKIIGQDDAINSLYEITKKIRYGYKNNNLPYSILFVGKSGVGKTYLAKEYANLLYGKDNFIRLDMSEYKEAHSISKLIGSPAGYVGYNDNKNVFEEVRNKPYSVILLDEIEKCSPNILDLFLQILDEGKVKDSKGNIIRFDNTIIIMTSNVGSDKKHVGFNHKENDYSTSLKSYFGVPFLNRINKTIYFNSITEEVIDKIINKELNTIRDFYKEKNIKFTLSKKVFDDIKNLCEYEIYGARKVKKVINDYLESKLIDKIIEGNNNIKIMSLKTEVR